MATYADINARLKLIARENRIPFEVFALGGSYGNTTLDMRCYDWKTGELTTGVTRLYTGTKNGLYDALGLMWNIRYEHKRNQARRKEGKQRRKANSLP